MKAACWIAGVVLVIALGWFVHLFALGDVVISNYATLDEARGDRLFERGWLPDILPPTTRDIRTANNLDLNLSEGHFSFSPTEHALFWSRVSPYASMHTPLEGFDGYVRRMDNRGFEAGSFSDEDVVWVFFCKSKEGCCEYTMWPQEG